MKHKHHIIPKHMGGCDNPSNLIELTVEEHAEAHRKLYEEHGCWQDYIAWKGLAGIIPRAEINAQLHYLSGKHTYHLKKGIHKEGFDKSKGGKIGGNKCKEFNLGIHKLTNEQIIENAKLGGIASKNSGKGVCNLSVDQRINIGNKCKEEKLGFHNPNFDKGLASRDKVWIKKDNNEMKCYPTELDYYYANGWQRGRLFKKRKKRNG